MKALFLILLSLSIASLAFGSTNNYTEEDGILILNKKNFQKALDEFKYLLVEFYDPSDDFCKKIAPEYISVAQNLGQARPDVKLAKLDAKHYKKLASKYDVDEFPSFKFFQQDRSTPLEYNGKLTGDSINLWLNKWLSGVSSEVKNIEELEELRLSNEVVALFIGSYAARYYNKFIMAVLELEKVKAVNTNDQGIKEKYGVRDNALIVFDADRKAQFIYEESAPTLDGYKKFVQQYENPSAPEFNEETLSNIFARTTDTVFFIKDKSEASEKAEKEFREVARKMNNGIIFTVVNNEEENGRRIAEYLGVYENDIPTVRILQPAKNMAKYKMEEKITVGNIKQFVEDFKKDRLIAYKKSEKIPEKPYDGNVRVLVGKNFEQVAMDTSKDVLVLFWAPGFGKSQTLVPLFAQIAEKYSSVKSLVLAKIDGANNELENVNLQTLPIMRLYKKDGKNAPVQYGDELEEKAIVRWMMKEGVIADDNIEL